MQSNNKENDPRIDWSLFGKQTREQINAEAAEEKAKLGWTGRRKRVVAFVNGKSYEISIPDVKAIRDHLGLTQEQFASRFHLSLRTVQQWEQRRAMPDLPARILLKAIEQAPDVIAKAAAAVESDLMMAGR